MRKSKTEEAGSLSKRDRQMLQLLFRKYGTAYGPVKNLVKASSLPVSKKKQLLDFKSVLYKSYSQQA